MNRKYLIFVGLVIVFVLIFSLFFIFKRNQLFYQQRRDLSEEIPEKKIEEVFNQEQNQQTITNNQIQTSTNQEIKEEKYYTMEEVSKHNSKESCWTVIRGEVYDLTQFISRHPGGEDKILPLCGKDGTQAFTQKHGGKEKPEKTLEKFEIGILKTQ